MINEGLLFEVNCQSIHLLQYNVAKAVASCLNTRYALIPGALSKVILNKGRKNGLTEENKPFLKIDHK